MKKYNGIYIQENIRVAIVISRFNSVITEDMLAGAEDCLTRHNIKNIDVFYVPGALEIPYTAKKLTEKNIYSGIITLGAVIRGETYHFDVVANESTKGIANLSLKSDIPIIMGIITVESLEQAINRAGAKSGNKGFDAAMSLIEMISMREIINGIK